MSDPHDHQQPDDGDTYAGALDHYTSPTRRGWVKQEGEEPEFVWLLDRALGRVRPVRRCPTHQRPLAPDAPRPATTAPTDPAGLMIGRCAAWTSGAVLASSSSCCTPPR